VVVVGAQQHGDDWKELRQPAREVHAFPRPLFMYNLNNGEVSNKGYTQKKRPAGNRQRSACGNQNAARAD
jgi:hypothetical protein